MRALPSVIARLASTLKLVPCKRGHGRRLRQRHDVCGTQVPADDVIASGCLPGPDWPAAASLVMDSSASAAEKASLVGANTVNGPGPDSAPARSAATTASTSTENTGFDCAICTTLSTPGGTSTLSITWITPLLAATSALVTLAWFNAASVSLTPDVVSTARVAGFPAKARRAWPGMCRLPPDRQRSASPARRGTSGSWPGSGRRARRPWRCASAKPNDLASEVKAASVGANTVRSASGSDNAGTSPALSAAATRVLKPALVATSARVPGGGRRHRRCRRRQERLRSKQPARVSTSSSWEFLNKALREDAERLLVKTERAEIYTESVFP